MINRHTRPQEAVVNARSLISIILICQHKNEMTLPSNGEPLFYRKMNIRDWMPRFTRQTYIHFEGMNILFNFKFFIPLHGI